MCSLGNRSNLPLNSNCYCLLTDIIFPIFGLKLKLLPFVLVFLSVRTWQSFTKTESVDELYKCSVKKRKLV